TTTAMAASAPADLAPTVAAYAAPAATGFAPAPTTVAATPASTVVAPVLPTVSTPVDAFINFGNGPYPGPSTLTTGNPQPWYNSPAVIQAFGGVLSGAQQASFTQSVIADIQHTFQISGMNISLTGEPNVPALHTLSVVSGASYPSNPNAIGISQVG